MTIIKINKKQGKIVSIVCEGHACFAEYGNDIVCAGISTIVCSCHLGLVKVLGLKPKHTQKEGKFSIELNEKDLTNEKAQVLLQTAMYSLEELAENYSKNLKIEIGG